MDRAPRSGARAGSCWGYPTTGEGKDPALLPRAVTQPGAAAFAPRYTQENEVWDPSSTSLGEAGAFRGSQKHSCCSGGASTPAEVTPEPSSFGQGCTCPRCPKPAAGPRSEPPRAGCRAKVVLGRGCRSCPAPAAAQAAPPARGRGGKGRARRGASPVAPDHQGSGRTPSSPPP